MAIGWQLGTNVMEIELHGWQYKGNKVAMY